MPWRASSRARCWRRAAELEVALLEPQARRQRRTHGRHPVGCTVRSPSCVQKKRPSVAGANWRSARTVRSSVVLARMAPAWRRHASAAASMHNVRATCRRRCAGATATSPRPSSRNAGGTRPRSRRPGRPARRRPPAQRSGRRGEACARRARGSAPPRRGSPTGAPRARPAARSPARPRPRSCSDRAWPQPRAAARRAPSSGRSIGRTVDGDDRLTPARRSV
jgi:hypothetical protein